MQRTGGCRVKKEARATHRIVRVFRVLKYYGSFPSCSDLALVPVAVGLSLPMGRTNVLKSSRCRGSCSVSHPRN